MNKYIKEFDKEYQELWSQLNNGLISQAEFLVGLHSRVAACMLKEHLELVSIAQHTQANIDHLESIMIPQ